MCFPMALTSTPSVLRTVERVRIRAERVFRGQARDRQTDVLGSVARRFSQVNWMAKAEHEYIPNFKVLVVVR